MSFPKFSEWMGLREAIAQPAPATGLIGVGSAKPKKPTNPKVKQAVANALKGGKVDPDKIMQAVSQTGDVGDMINVANSLKDNA